MAGASLPAIFLDRGLPVNLAVIPDVRTDVPWTMDARRVFSSPKWELGASVSIGDTRNWFPYLRDNPGFISPSTGSIMNGMNLTVKDRTEIRRRLGSGRTN